MQSRKNPEFFYQKSTLNPENQNRESTKILKIIPKNPQDYFEKPPKKPTGKVQIIPKNPQDYFEKPPKKPTGKVQTIPKNPQDYFENPPKKPTGKVQTIPRTPRKNRQEKYKLLSNNPLKNLINKTKGYFYTLSFFCIKGVKGESDTRLFTSRA